MNWSKWTPTLELEFRVTRNDKSGKRHRFLYQKWTRTGWPMKRFPTRDYFEHFEEEWRLVKGQTE